MESTKAEEPIDMSLSDDERHRRAAFAIARKRNTTLFECESCLLLFDDPIIHRIHVVMHDHTPFACTMCRESFSDRIAFHRHMIEREHSMIPDGVSSSDVKLDDNGLPDLWGLVVETAANKQVQ